MLLQVDGVLGSGTLVSYSLINLESRSTETDSLGNMAPHSCAVTVHFIVDLFNHRE